MQRFVALGFECLAFKVAAAQSEGKKPSALMLDIVKLTIFFI
jgi:hypothetical protein